MFYLTTNKLLQHSLFAFLILFSASGHADDVEESIQEALQSYKAGDFKEASDSLNYASQLVQQKRGSSLESFLPEPLKGWIAQNSSSETSGAAAMFGGGITAEREYNKDSASVTIQIITDSPLIQGMMMMFSNPMFATADGGKFERIGRQKAIVKYDSQNRDGDIKIVIGNRILVLIEGQGIEKDDLKAYAKGIDFIKLKSLP